MEEKTSIEELKEDYEILKNKYSLPDFTELNKDFSIEKISEIETELLLKEIRKFIADKLIHYSNFIEAILNPSNHSMFMFSFIRSICAKEKTKANEIYKELSKIRLQLIKVDITYSEEKEAEFIKNSFKKWKNIKEDIISILKNAEENFENKTPQCNNKDYFG
ncbi:MAG: hypothetical protein ACOC3Z_00350 [Nanoarchaeota archaeon]